MVSRTLYRCAAAAAVTIGLPAFLMAQTPVVMTVPFVASNPLALHTSWSGNTVTLKGTMSSSAPGDAFVYDWNPGDGGTHCSGNVTIGAGPQTPPNMDSYGIECQH